MPREFEEGPRGVWRSPKTTALDICHFPRDGSFCLAPLLNLQRPRHFSVNFTTDINTNPEKIGKINLYLLICSSLSHPPDSQSPWPLNLNLSWVGTTSAQQMELQKAICCSVPAFSAKVKKILILRGLMHMFISLILFCSYRTICMAVLACKGACGAESAAAASSSGGSSVGGRGHTTSTLRQLVRLCISSSAWRSPRPP